MVNVRYWPIAANQSGQKRIANPGDSGGIQGEGRGVQNHRNFFRHHQGRHKNHLYHLQVFIGLILGSDTTSDDNRIWAWNGI